MGLAVTEHNIYNNSEPQIQKFDIAALIRIGTMVSYIMDSLNQDPIPVDIFKNYLNLSIIKIQNGLNDEDLTLEFKNMFQELDENPSLGELRVVASKIIGWINGSFKGEHEKGLITFNPADYVCVDLNGGEQPLEKAHPTGQYL